MGEDGPEASVAVEEASTLGMRTADLSVVQEHVCHQD